MIRGVFDQLTKHFLEYKYFYLIVVICFAQIISIERVDLSKLLPTHDTNSYKQMALASPFINHSVVKPFAYRLLAPWLTGLLFENVDLGFTILTTLFSILFVITLFIFLTKHNISKRIAFLITAAFIFNRYFISLFAYEPYRLADVISNFLLLLAFILLEEKKYWAVFTLSVIGLFVRESLLLLVPTGIVFVLLYDRKNASVWVTLSSILISIFLIIRHFLNFELGLSITEQFMESWTKLFSPEVLVKQLFIAFNPLFLIPVFSFKKFIVFNKNNVHWFILLLSVLFASLFGGDKERLMFPYVPIYYLFIAVLFQHLEDAAKINTTAFLTILAVSWIANLHHMWGMIKLPSREYSLAFAVIGGIVMLIIYLSLKSKRIEFIK